MRADARRNYERLVVAARKVFAEEGGGASMEAIAREAGVGVGTLYRHFPKRIDVVEAVYRTTSTNCRRGRAVVASWSRGRRSWLARGVRPLRAGQAAFLNELHEAFEKNPELRVRRGSGSRARWTSCSAGPAGRAWSAPMWTASDLMQLLGPMCTSATLSGISPLGCSQRSSTGSTGFHRRHQGEARISLIALG